MAKAVTNVAVTFTNIGAVPTHGALWDAATGGNLKGSTAITFGVAPVSGGNVVFAAGTIDIEIPNGELTDSGSEDAVDGVIGSTLYAALHTGSPPSAGNQVTVDGDDRKAITSSQWTVS